MSNKSFFTNALLGIMIATGIVVAGKIDVKADNTIITGTVSKGTNASTLYLYSPSNGTYTVKIDNDTNTTACKTLTVGKTVTVSMYRGNDANMHAASIASGTSAAAVSVDSSNRATVTGTVLDTTTDQTLYLKTSSGDMTIKLDPTTDMSGSKVIVAGVNASVVVARGSDAYMHAISISTNGVSSESGITSGDSSSSSQTPSDVSNYIQITGTPTNDCKNGVLYLKCSDGTYYLNVDDGAAAGGFVFTDSNKLTAYIYRGNDATMHAARITGKRSSGASIGSSTTTFSGTVSSSSTEEMLYLITSGGTMKIKLDASTSLVNTKNLIKGQTVTVSGSIGSDAYWHAVTITGK